MLRKPVARGQVSGATGTLNITVTDAGRLGPSQRLTVLVRNQFDDAEFGQPGEHVGEIRSLLAPGQAHDGWPPNRYSPAGGKGGLASRKPARAGQPVGHPDERRGHVGDHQK